MKSKKPRTTKAESELLLERHFAEAELEGLAHDLAKFVKVGDRVVLEGPMGAGKSTFTRALLKAMGVQQPFEGSPTFPIAHEYDVNGNVVVHIDFYRLHSIEEVEQAGLIELLWDSSKIVIMEWLSQIPELEQEISAHRIELDFVPDQPEIRSVRCELRARS